MLESNEKVNFRCESCGPFKRSPFILMLPALIKSLFDFLLKKLCEICEKFCEEIIA